MERASDLELKYQKLATEYSKIRSHATVLKKAVLDEQSKILELKEIIKEQEQRIRKHDQEMDSLTFRNGQLTKRIAVLQQELQGNSRGKKAKIKSSEHPAPSNFSVIDEELHKKIVENAQLVSAMADKDLEITNNLEKICWLEDKINSLNMKIDEDKEVYKKETEQLKKLYFQKYPDSESLDNKKECDRCKKKEELEKEITFWKQESERWSTECEVLRQKPVSNEELTQYYESQLRTILETQQTAVAKSDILSAENDALNTRLEHIMLEKMLWIVY
ncbi:smooth muscle myosin heavy chain-related [Holotrichia oblita]|uniref:Smooth muscle myosin heavy chain-related n=1 Tax=Holotrichia oblita TaxID=644536 RepID=A0ACB9TN75_HOLOL|nr:smooth muscle myosin heavy chain-related [Holotrichia oblita]